MPQVRSMHKRKPGTILFVAAFAAFLATFNETFPNVGFAPIMKSLAVDVTTVQWLTTTYMLGAAAMVPVSAFAALSALCLMTEALVLRDVVKFSHPTRPLFNPAH